ncbi:MAG TPA: molybdopterin cofactor-binding domain-containing protein [Candidatus Acidoferrum sp.]|nr:molybdopterin cofactor-binding domain-containing protein [Candidatus Acidoferrum sp.]
MNTNDFLAANFRDIHSYEDFFASNRRDFLKRVGGGIVIFVALNDVLLGQEEARRPRGGRPGLPSDFNAFLRIGEDGRVTCLTGKIEMGQGPITSLPQMLAEELDTPLDTVDIVMGDTDLCPWDMGTFGSMTTRIFGPALCAAAAEAKLVLLELAAEQLKVPQSQLAARDGIIFDQENKDHRLTYGQLAKGQKIERHLQAKPALKKPADYRIAGKSLTRRDGEVKATGKAHYAADVRVPGMLYAKILRPPAHGAKLKSVDTAPAKAVAGVQVVQDGDLVAVLHEFPDVAENALGKIKADFDVPEATFNDKTVFDHLLKVAPESRVLKTGGDLEAGQKDAAKKFDCTYLNSYVAHSPMEPHAALAQIEGDQATVWASTQNPFGARDEIATAIGFPAQKVRVIAPFVGGGFGGKTNNREAVEAARLAKAAGKPVQVMWSRAEEFFYDSFRPAAIVKINSGVDAAGKMIFWDYDVYFAGERGAQQFYTVPNHRTAARGSGFGGPASAHPFATGAWRAPGNNTNTFARESQIDIMAAGAGIDPVEFRLNNLSDARMIRVLKAAAEKFGWTPAKGPSRRGFGVACGTDAGSYVAAIAEVAVNKDKGTVQVKRVVCAQDMGVIINPEGAKIQMEGCITMGLGYAFTEEVRFNGGAVLDTNYDTYEIPRFSWVPKIETVLVENNDTPPQGGGEPAIILMGALMANAIYDAAGARLFQLPMTTERVKAAIQKA